MKRPTFPKTTKAVRKTQAVLNFCLNPLCLHDSRGCRRSCCRSGK